MKGLPVAKTCLTVKSLLNFDLMSGISEDIENVEADTDFSNAQYANDTWKTKQL